MRKLIKSKKDVNRERLKSLTLPPTRSESSEGFLQLPHHDSQDSSSVGSNSLEDGQTLATKKSSTMNDLVQSMVLAGGQWTGSSEHLEGPDDISAGKRKKELGTMAFSTTAINFATVNSSSGFKSKQLLNNKDTTSFEDVSPQGISDDSSTGSRVQVSRPASLDSGRTSTSNSNNNASLHEVKAGGVSNQSRPQSHSSGEFSLLHEHEAWSSSSSSPVQYLKSHTKSSPKIQQKMPETGDNQGKQKIKTGSPGSEVVTLQQFLEESNKISPTEMKYASQENLLDEVMKSLSESAELAGKEKLRKHSSVSSGIVRSLSMKNTGDFLDGRSAKPEHLIRLSPHKTEDTCFTSSPVKSIPGTQGKVTSVKGKIQTNLPQRQSKDCNPYATLPRASSVISTAEGTTRRTSIHDFLSKDSRQPVSIDPAPSTADRSVPSAYSEYCVHQQPSNFFHYTPYNVASVPQSYLGDTIKTDHLGCKSEQPRNSRVVMSNFVDQTSSSKMFSDEVGVSAKDSSGPFTVTHVSQPFLSLNTELVSNISGLPQRSASKVTDQTCVSSVKSLQKDHELSSHDHKSDNSNSQSGLDSEFTASSPCVNISKIESPLLVSEDNQSVWYEYGCV